MENKIEKEYVNIKLTIKDINIIKNALIFSSNPTENNKKTIEELNQFERAKELVIKILEIRTDIINRF